VKSSCQRGEGDRRGLKPATRRGRDHRAGPPVGRSWDDRPRPVANSRTAGTCSPTRPGREVGGRTAMRRRGGRDRALDLGWDRARHPDHQAEGHDAAGRRRRFGAWARRPLPGRPHRVHGAGGNEPADVRAGREVRPRDRRAVGAGRRLARGDGLEAARGEEGEKKPGPEKLVAVPAGWATRGSGAALAGGARGAGSERDDLDRRPPGHLEKADLLVGRQDRRGRPRLAPPTGRRHHAATWRPASSTSTATRRSSAT
jgi:hypothetical protein